MRSLSSTSENPSRIGQAFTKHSQRGETVRLQRLRTSVQQKVQHGQARQNGARKVAALDLRRV